MPFGKFDEKSKLDNHSSSVVYSWYLRQELNLRLSVISRVLYH